MLQEIIELTASKIANATEPKLAFCGRVMNIGYFDSYYGNQKAAAVEEGRNWGVMDTLRCFSGYLTRRRNNFEKHPLEINMGIQVEFNPDLTPEFIRERVSDIK